jgi:hypothetical protein
MRRGVAEWLTLTKPSRGPIVLHNVVAGLDPAIHLASKFDGCPGLGALKTALRAFCAAMTRENPQKTRQNA